MSRKVNNLRKRLRQVEQQNEKALRSLSLRERDLIAREARCKTIESRKPPTVDDGIVSIVLRRERNLGLRGKVYAFQMVVDFDCLRYMSFRDNFDIRESGHLCYGVQREMNKQIQLLFEDIMKSQYPDGRIS
jgi:hypothetical protein